MSTVEIHFNNNTLKYIEKMPDKTIYAIARKTLDYSTAKIPMDTGKMRRLSQAYGVKGSKGDYHIGSPTRYASHVWNLPARTHWTTPGTNNQWFKRALKEHKASIINSAINEVKKG